VDALLEKPMDPQLLLTLWTARWGSLRSEMRRERGETRREPPV